MHLINFRFGTELRQPLFQGTKWELSRNSEVIGLLPTYASVKSTSTFTLAKIIASFGSGLKLQTSAETTGDEYIRVPRGQERITYDMRKVHTTGDENIQVHISTQKAGDQYMPSG